MVELKPFTILTDHKPIIAAFRKASNTCSPRQFRYLDFVSQFTTDVRHISGDDNVVADTLSRIESMTTTIDLDKLACSQDRDMELEHIRNDSSLDLQKINVSGSEKKLFCDVSNSPPRLYLTSDYRRQAFDSVHGLSHPGARTTIKLMTDRYVWPGIRKDCREWTRTCIACQKSKVFRHTYSPVQAFTPPSGRFSHVHIDIIGPLPVSNEYKYCLTAVDRYTRWPEVMPVRDIKADTVAHAFVTGWISRFGCPHNITTDRGRQFESHLFKELTRVTGSRHFTTTAYHPAANGLVERFHRQLKAAIMCHANENWYEVLPLVLLGIRSAWKEDISSTSAELVYGENLRLPSDMFRSSPTEIIDHSDFLSRLRAHIRQLKPTLVKRHGASNVFVHKDLSQAPAVFLRQDAVRRPLQPPYTGPYKVIERTNKAFKIDIGGKIVIVSIDRLKPAYVLPEPNDPIPTPSWTTKIVTAKPPHITRSGRRVKFTNFYRP